MQTVWDHVRLAAARTPGHAAMVDDRRERRLTHGQLIAEAETVAAGLAEAGVAPGSRVATMLPNLWEHAIAILALHRLATVPCLVNPRLKPDEAGALMRDGGVAAAICMADAYGAVRDSLPSAAPLFCVGGALPGARDFQACRGRAGNLDPWRAPSPEALSLVLYTSGTSGLPKGVMLPHRVTDARVLYVTTQCGLRHGVHNRAIGLMPLFHAVGLYSTFLATLSMNGTYYVHSSFDPAAAIDRIDRDAVTFLYGTPAHFHALLEAPGFAAERVSSVETLAYAGACMPGPLLERVAGAFPGARITNIYGTTEVMNALYMPDPAGRPNRYRPGFYSDVRVCRIGGGGEPCDTGEEGEILVDAGADAAFSGYLNRPDATAERVVDGWYHTGDIGVPTPDGDLELRGRVDDMIVSGGENIHPEEVESVLMRHGGVQDAAVVGVPDDRWTERVVACCVAAGGLEAGDLDSWCRDSPLANYKRPRDYVFLDALPRNAANKVLRRALRDIAIERLE